MKIINRLLSFCILTITLFSCKVDSGITSPYVSYYKGDNTLLYFIKPLKMSGESNKGKVDVDFTFNDQKDSDSSFVTVNYTVYNLTLNGTVKSYIECNGNTIDLQKNEKVFQEFVSGSPKIRYTSQLSKASFLSVLKYKDFTFKLSALNSKEEVFRFLLKRKYHNKLNKTSTQLYDILSQKITQ